MLYFLMPGKSTKYFNFNYELSLNYFDFFYTQKKLSQDTIRVVNILSDMSKLDTIRKLDFIYSHGPILISLKVKALLQREFELGLVQFFDVEIEGLGIMDTHVALHVINIEPVADLGKSIYRDDNDDEYRFDKLVLNEEFEWDLTIARALGSPTKIIINEGLKNRFVEGGVKGLILYTIYNPLKPNESKFIKI